MKKLVFFTLVAVIVLMGTACPAPPAPASPSPTPAVTSPSPAISAPPAGTLEERLDRMADRLEQQRLTLHIPGMALVVVKDGQVVFSSGFGVSDIEKNTPVTPETLFPIGSTTKAFTSTLVGMLVDEGKMDWNDPVTRYLPYFDLNIRKSSSDAREQVTLGDVMSHRTGFTRMGLLTASGQVPIEEVLQDAVAAEPYAGFRSRFYYSNEVFMSAGVAAGKAAGSDWNTLVAERIFRPLGMDNTTTSITQVQGDPRLASGYTWDEDLQDYKLKPLRNVDNIAPAGSINSNILDMAEWLRLQLGNGLYEGKRLVSEKSLKQTRTPYVGIAPGIDYGLGWMIREWNGQTVVEHGGNVDGFSAEVAMLPESDLGFVLLTNSTANALPQLSLNIVWETLMGEWKDADSGSQDYDPYLGKYIADFASFKNSVFTVLVQNGNLAVDIPGQMVYELKAPDAEGKWYFAVSDQIAVSFDRNAAGEVTGMRMYQAGLTFEIPREGFEIRPEIPLDELQKYLGLYRSEELNTTVTVMIHNNRLAIDVPGQMVYELFPPGDDGQWVFRATDSISVSFNEAAGEEIESLTMYQAGREYVMPRIEAVSIPTVDDVVKLRQVESRLADFEAILPFKAEGTIEVPQSGVTGKFTLIVADGGRYRLDVDYGKYGHSSTAVNGDRGWTRSSFAPFEELHGKMLEQAKLGHPAVFNSDWHRYFRSIEFVRVIPDGSDSIYVLELQHEVLPPMTVYIEGKTGEVSRVEYIEVSEAGVQIPVVTDYEDFRLVEGVWMPFREISANEESGRAITQYNTVETGIDIDEEIFILSSE